MKKFLEFVFAFGMFFMLVHWLTPYDATDDEENSSRSGLGFYIDYGTGCQYLSGGLFGGITPRLDIEGNHICE